MNSGLGCEPTEEAVGVGSALQGLHVESLCGAGNCSLSRNWLFVGGQPPRVNRPQVSEHQIQKINNMVTTASKDQGSNLRYCLCEQVRPPLRSVCSCVAQRGSHQPFD